MNYNPFNSQEKNRVSEMQFALPLLTAIADKAFANLHHRGAESSPEDIRKVLMLHQTTKNVIAEGVARSVEQPAQPPKPAVETPAGGQTQTLQTPDMNDVIDMASLREAALRHSTSSAEMRFEQTGDDDARAA